MISISSQQECIGLLGKQQDYTEQLKTEEFPSRKTVLELASPHYFILMFLQKKEKSKKYGKIISDGRDTILWLKT
jgi:hypothetical protein